MKKPVVAVVLALATACIAQGPSDLVHPRIGTANEGQTFPATGVPFGMTNWTPQTRDGEEKCIPPYYAADTKIQGFRGSHFLSGSCTQDYGSFTFMPGAGALKLEAAERASTFGSEKTRPSLYQVDLLEYGIHAEMTGTTRSGMLRLRYENPGEKWMVVQANARAVASGDRSVHIDREKNELWGQNAVTRIYSGLGKPAGFHGYFVAQFDHKFKDSAGWSPRGVTSIGDIQGGADKPGAHLHFDLKPGEVLQVRIGTSFTSVDEARRNLAAEIPDWNFARVAGAAEKEWNDALGSIQVAGSAPARSIFYTAMYHVFLLPRIVSDADGSRLRFAGGPAVERSSKGVFYDDYSIWDTFRAVHPLLTILDPARDAEMVQSLVVKGTEGGFLPIYPAWNSYTSEMVGDHADAIIADAYFKGIRGFDVAKAYELMLHNALVEPTPQEDADGRGRRALPSYRKYGYIPLEDHVSTAYHHDEQVSRTLEYAYDDFLIAKMAGALGKPADAEAFTKRASFWKNVIDPQTGFARGRHDDGSWITPFDPTQSATYITEGLPFQYTFFVPQDIPGLMQHVGGRAAFEAKLDTLFSKGYYNHGNEPSHHIAYLFNDAGAAWKTQREVRNILDKSYADAVNGLAGNEDAGQMSAWYVMSALGMYAVTPGLPEYELTAPRFDDMTVTLTGGKSLHVLAPGTESGKHFIRAVRLNGRLLPGHTIRHTDVMGGGELQFTLASTPDPTWPSH